MAKKAIVVYKKRAGGKKKSKSARNVPDGVLDVGGAAWARLLADPCNAPLVNPVYPSGSFGGQLVRVESDFIAGAGATQTAVAVLYTPGLYATSIASAATWPLSLIEAETDVITGNWAPTSRIPGATQYGAWQSVRAVASCVQVTWPGSELNRQGTVAMGQVSSNIIFTTGTSTSALRQLCPRVDRMPDGTAEIKWRPTERDGTTTGGDSVDVTQAGGRGSMLISVAGIPVATGVRFRIVTVLEVTPKQNSGFVLAPSNNNQSRHTTSQVLDVLDRTGHWFYEAGATIAKAYDVGARLYKTAAAYGRVANRVLPMIGM